MATSIFKEYFKGYEILGELGRGNARVLKAKSVHTGELVAIKHFAFNSEPDAIRRFQRESEIMKSIQHENIVKIIEVHLDAELPYIVMQLVEGGDLRSLLKTHGSLDISTVITLGQHMTEALDAIHARAVVHRDIKPENIMYRRLPNGEMHFLLTDFGIAKLREQSDGITATGASMLTYDYASPEQFNQTKTVSTPTDYYSLGVVLYECLTGKVPFEFEQEDLLFHINRVISCPIPPPRIPSGHPMPPSLLHLLMGLMTKNNNSRLADPAEVCRLLQLASLEDMQACSPAVRKTTQKANVQLLATMPALHLHKNKKRDLRFTAFVLTLIAVAIFLGYNNLVKSNTRVPESTVEEEAPAFTPLVSNIKHSLPVGTDLVMLGKPSYMPDNIEVPGDAHAATESGVELVNGIYYNDFSNEKDSLWHPGKDENSEFNFQDGKYVMTGLTDSLSYSASIKFNLDIQKDFTVMANTAHWGDSTGDPFGINFCGDENEDAYFIFYITSNGFYSIGTSIKGEWNVLVDWTETSHIRKDADLNILSIEKQADSLRFFINGKLEKVLPFTSGFGNYFGLRVDGAQTVSFDQFIVKGSQ
jgi:eukaryotic-like serine/threonine-protein kinase